MLLASSVGTLPNLVCLEFVIEGSIGWDEVLPSIHGTDLASTVWFGVRVLKIGVSYLETCKQKTLTNVHERETLLEGKL